MCTIYGKIKPIEINKEKKENEKTKITYHLSVNEFEDNRKNIFEQNII